MRKHVANLIRVITDHIGHPLEGAEVGCWRGHSSADLCRTFPMLHLHMVDTWKAWPPGTSYNEEHTDMGKMTQEEWDLVFLEAMSKVSCLPNKKTISIMDSVSAAKKVADSSLDFVFLDANHTYEAVKQDILCWRSKVRSGGIISGHDYGSFRDRTGQWGITKAVHEIFTEEKVIKPVGSTRVWAVIIKD